MDKCGKLRRKDLFSAVQLAAFPFIHLINLLKREECKHPDAFQDIGIADVAPVLIKIIRRGFLRIKPYRAGLRLTHFFAFRIEKECDCHRLRFCILFFQPQLLSDQLTASQHVRPLVVSAELKVAAVFLVEDIEVIRLHDHIVKFKEAEPLLHTLLVAFGTQHIVDGKVCADLTQQFNIVQVKQPVGIVYHDGFVIGKVDKTAHLNLEAFNVVIDDLFRHHRAHVGSAGRIADHAGSTAEQGNRFIPCLLQTLH